MANTRDTTMANPSASMSQERSEWRGPEIYLHLEFRVAWSRKPQPVKNHQVTYRSRASRERAPAFPRQVHAPNTNYLAAIRDFDQRQAVRRSLLAEGQQRAHHQLQEYYQEDTRGRPQHQIPIIHEPEQESDQRRSRAESVSSHERGSSAPPPIGDNPWDVSVPRGQQTKALPPAPSQFRLGEGSDPWSTWSLPPGFDPTISLQDEPEDSAQRPQEWVASNPTEVSTFSPEPAQATTHARDHVESGSVMTSPFSPEHFPDQPDTGRVRELEALSAAMMTVDNGFENQWWYQGRRAQVAEDANETRSLHSPRPGTPEHVQLHRWSTEPIGSPETMSATVSGQTPSLAQTGFVSPITEAASPALGFGTLQRTLSTRSEELWFSERA
ncbi:uncharacterized protein PODANS_5_6120 [Podospora anserina S mat+]|uniref:Podospora anserina S mat+ genomic DNA chromosome 5, supercontig 6 n=2 Tax=Podospora anserina TaxID=2587412 RepID=B2VLH0_PODAN|nr:uncharacterized protein PODANS_5_6120 [Podospora anserina S mat+]CAD60766.1 unnamed protein product [Podospora anserina]CAP49286.1 unnamed protein product [Podospora anserina S mat+]CDP29590.1 Putative protein of unknown function [Podospora anserina S mat+]